MRWTTSPSMHCKPSATWGLCARLPLHRLSLPPLISQCIYYYSIAMSITVQLLLWLCYYHQYDIWISPIDSDSNSRSIFLSLLRNITLMVIPTYYCGSNDVHCLYFFKRPTEDTGNNDLMSTTLEPLVPLPAHWSVVSGNHAYCNDQSGVRTEKGTLCCKCVSRAKSDSLLWKK